MEFIATTILPTSAADLQRRLIIGELPRWCASIEKVLRNGDTSGEIFCVWGTFETNREDLSYGVRFTLPSCPMALQWSITTGHQPNPKHTVIHCSINRTEQDPDFIETVKQFVVDWKAGLEANW